MTALLLALPAPARKPEAWADMPYRDTALAQLERDEGLAQSLTPTGRRKLSEPSPLVIDEFWLLQSQLARQAPARSVFHPQGFEKLQADFAKQVFAATWVDLPMLRVPDSVPVLPA